jgi:hypothetical protein
MVLPQTMWLSILAVIIGVILLSSVMTIMAYQQPTTSQQTNTILTYSGNSQFSYLTNLFENTVYNKTLLRPGEGIIFKQLVDSVNGSHQYRFQISTTASITVSYTVQAIIRTDLWTKTYTLVPTQTSNTTGTRLTISESFPIDYRFYDSILREINEETGVTAPNPILLIRASISTTARTDDYTISESFNPEITMTLNQKTITFSEMLSLSKSGSRSETITIDYPEVLQTRSNRLYTSIGSGLILIPFIFLTKMQVPSTSALEKELRKIKKKYGEWLVTAESDPVDSSSKPIIISSIDELSRISEDLGKPMIHYQKDDSTNIFFVIDDNHVYRHELTINDEKETDFFSFFKGSNRDASTEASMVSRHNSIKDAEREHGNQKKVMSKTVNCIHCKSSFTVDEEVTSDITKIEITCPFCEQHQIVSFAGKNMPLKRKLSSFFKQDH